MMANRLKTIVWRVDVGLRFCAAGGSDVFGARRSGVAGERCVPSTLVRWSRKDDVERVRWVVSAGMR